MIMLMKHTVQMCELSHAKWQENRSSFDSHKRLSYVYDKSLKRMKPNIIIQISEQDQTGSFRFVDKVRIRIE